MQCCIYYNYSIGMPHSPKLSCEEVRYLSERLYDGYFGFEVLTRRNWDEAVCGICGICPLFESGDGNCKNWIPIKKNNYGMYTPAPSIYYWQESRLYHNNYNPDLKLSGIYPAKWRRQEL